MRLLNATATSRRFYRPICRNIAFWFGAFAGWMDTALLPVTGAPTPIFGPAADGSHGSVEWEGNDSVETFVRTGARAAYVFCGS